MVCAVTLGACSGAIAPRTWAASVCRSLTPWRAEIAMLNSNAQTEMSTTTTPEDTRTHLIELLGGAQRASEKARAAVATAGVPDVRGGAEIERRFVAALTSVRDAYARAEQAISALATTNADVFYRGVADVMTTLNADYAKSGLNTDQLVSPELQADFDKVVACR